MIRYLLASMAILGVVIFDAKTQAAVSNPTPALATPQLKITGQTSFNSWFFKNNVQLEPGNAADRPQSRRKYGRGQLFTVDDARLRFNVDGKTDRGMEYGLVIVLDGTVGEEKTVRENYLYFGGSWGKLYLGNTYGVQSTMSFGGWDQWGGTGFMDGQDFDRVINFTYGVPHTLNLVGDSNRDTKLSYLTPRWNGLQLGFSYTPRTEHRGEEKINTIRSTVRNKKPFDTDNIAGGVNFIHKFTNGFEMALSATAILGKTHPEFAGTPSRKKNVASFAFGGTFSYADIGFSFEYGNNGRSHERTGQHLSNAGQFVDFGLSYTWGATKFSTGFFYGWRNALGSRLANNTPANQLQNPNTFTRVKSKTHAISAAIDHKLAPGLGVYFEYAHFQMKNPAAQVEARRLNQELAPGNFSAPVPSNRANAFVIGSRLVF